MFIFNKLNNNKKTKFKKKVENNKLQFNLSITKPI